MKPVWQDSVPLSTLTHRPAVAAGGEEVGPHQGLFDLLHVGCVRYLKEAKSLGDLLIMDSTSELSDRILARFGKRG